MRISTVTKRVTKLENTLTGLRLGKKSGCRCGEQMDDSTVPLPKQLQKLAQETKQIKEQAVASEDYRTALACIREHCRILELIARLGGELDEKTQTNNLDVTLDSGTGNRSWENPRHQAASRLCVDAQPLWHFLSRTAHGLSHRPWARRGDYSETHAQATRRGFCRCVTIAEAAITLRGKIVVIFISRPFEAV